MKIVDLKKQILDKLKGGEKFRFSDKNIISILVFHDQLFSSSLM